MAEERTHTDSGTGTPIAENEQVKALLALLKENDSPAYVDFAKLIESVTGMENRLSIAVGELEAMREDLQKMQDRSLKASLQKTCKRYRPCARTALREKRKPMTSWWRQRSNGNSRRRPRSGLTGRWHTYAPRR